VEDLACRLALLVVQPAQREFGCPLSAPVRRAADRVVEGLAAVLRRS
jgi:Ni,Fe-hydrogenase maturation factor